jgi:hypothetical protein
MYTFWKILVLSLLSFIDILKMAFAVLVLAECYDMIIRSQKESLWNKKGSASLS